MLYVEIAAESNGAHRNQISYGGGGPEGFAAVPPGIEIPSTFPFVGITVENGVVTSMTAGTVPTPVDEPDDTQTTDTAALAAKVAELEAALAAMKGVTG